MKHEMVERNSVIVEYVSRNNLLRHKTFTFPTNYQLQLGVPIAMKLSLFLTVRSILKYISLFKYFLEIVYIKTTLLKALQENFAFSLQVKRKWVHSLC